MALPQIVSRDEWRAARKALLAEEKALTRRRDALNAVRRGLPMSGSRRTTRSAGRPARPACLTCSRVVVS